MKVTASSHGRFRPKLNDVKVCAFLLESLSLRRISCVILYDYIASILSLVCLLSF